jgi:hypothetical protein
MKRAIAAVASFALLALSGCDDMPLRNMIVDLVTRASVSGPAAPSDLSASFLSVSMIHLSWTDNSSDETGFKIERSPEGSSGWTQVFLTSADATAWDDSGLSPGTTYYYRVRATNGGGDSAYSNTTSASTLLIIAMITVNAAGDSFTMGDGTYGPNKSQTISYNFTMSKYDHQRPVCSVHRRRRLFKPDLLDYQRMGAEDVWRLDAACLLDRFQLEWRQPASRWSELV